MVFKFLCVCVCKREREGAWSEGHVSFWCPLNFVVCVAFCFLKRGKMACSWVGVGGNDLGGYGGIIRTWTRRYKTMIGKNTETADLS